MRKANRAAAGAAAWQIIRNTDGKVSVWRRVRALPRMLGAKLSGRYPELGNSKLLGMLVLLAYIISPVDFVPELFFSVFGLVDDVAVAVWLTTMALGESERFVLWERDQQAKDAFQRTDAEEFTESERARGGAESGPARESGEPVSRTKQRH